MTRKVSSKFRRLSKSGKCLVRLDDGLKIRTVRIVLMRSPKWSYAIVFFVEDHVGVIEESKNWSYISAVFEFLSKNDPKVWADIYFSIKDKS